MTKYYRSSELIHRKDSRALLYIIGILLLFTSQNKAALQAREVGEILESHNMYRRIYANGAYSVHVADMRKLKWSYELQEQSLRQLKCEDIDTLLTVQDIKMNIGFSLNRNYTDIIRSWFNEILYFLPKYKRCPDLNNCKHFMTMMNSQHRRLGCAATKCLVNAIEKHVMVCLYDGGKDFTNLYKTGKPCTKCTNEESFCERGLCVPCSRPLSECDCRKNCFKSGVGIGRLNSTTCSCECSFGMGPNCDEKCENPEIYIDYDICDSVTTENCLSANQDERDMLAEFCPEQCLCNKLPKPEDD